MRDLTPVMRDLLIEHIDGPVPLDRSIPYRTSRLFAARSAGLIRFDRPDRPRFSMLTVKGRQWLAEVLADWAEALTRAAGLRS